MFQNKTVSAVILAAGSSLRYGQPDKLWEDLGGRPLLCRSVDAFLSHPAVDRVTLVTRKEKIPSCRAILPGAVEIVEGGETRCASSLAGVRAASTDLVLIHDASRPFADSGMITRCIAKAAETGAAAAAVPAVDTVKLCTGEGRVTDTPPRPAVWQVQTPQAFSRERLLLAAGKVNPHDPAITDDCMVMEQAGFPVYLVEGDRRNLKVTTAADYQVALWQERAGRPSVTRTAIGQDSHRFEEEITDKPLLLGGVEIPGEPALAANSDGDVLLHALCNAVSGLSGVNILGRRADELCREGIIDSAVYVGEAMSYLKGRLTHLSFSVECKTPRLAAFIPAMRQSIGAIAGLPPGQVGITATTGEGLTDCGKGLGVSVFCIATGEVAQ